MQVSDGRPSRHRRGLTRRSGSWSRPPPRPGASGSDGTLACATRKRPCRGHGSAMAGELGGSDMPLPSVILNAFPVAHSASQFAVPDPRWGCPDPAWIMMSACPALAKLKQTAAKATEARFTNRMIPPPSHGQKRHPAVSEAETLVLSQQEAQVGNSGLCDALRGSKPAGPLDLSRASLFREESR